MKFPVVRCPHCGLVYVNPRPVGRLSRRFYPSEEYPFSTGGESQPVAHYQPIIDWLRSHRQSGRLLDIGTGNSPLLPHMKQHGWKVEGTELNESHAAFFREHYGIRLFVGEVEDAAYPNGAFDAVTLVGACEHLRDPLTFFSEANRILDKDGLLAIWCFNRGMEARMLGGFWPGFDPPRHLYSYSVETLEKMLNAASFEVESVRYSASSYFFHAAMYTGKLIHRRLSGSRSVINVRHLPRLLELMSRPPGLLLSVLHQSPHIYLLARKVAA